MRRDRTRNASSGCTRSTCCRDCANLTIPPALDVQARQRDQRKVDLMTASPVLGRTGTFLFPWGKDAPSADTLMRLAARADELGLDSVHFPYFFNLPANEWPWGNRSLLDALAMIPFIAARTERVKLCLSHWNFS